MKIFNYLRILTIVHCIRYGLGGGCDYEIDGPASENLDIATNKIGNQSVLVLNITHIDDGKQAIHITAAERDGSSSYFEIINNEVFITSCPPVGESQSIQTILMSGEMIPLDGCIYSIGMTVVPSVPEILVSKNISVLVSSLDNDLDVLSFDFANANECTKFICSVKCTNDKKIFWIDDVNVIRTSPQNITYDFLYELDLTCYEGGPWNNETNSAMVQVNFRRIPATGNSAESSTLFIKACGGIVCCIAHILNIFF